ncbi:TIM barrel protein [Maritalea mobilis]|uniref:hydroxypyruvate isomerase family protein n=1 Tax=Maritalea mobilis TaxID=483324 RepID=UPI001C975DF8|nr:TIM barrel protein [Maritalea mobilis]MBY6201779.1 TIM barrel protein [Maritalea mobilis]
MRFSANLGFLWAGHPLPTAIRRAAAAGFDAVECHWPYAEEPAAVRAALEETGLPMLGLNTVRGGEGCFGLSALPDREPEARAAIEQAMGYAVAVGAEAVHVMAGFAKGREADGVFRSNLRFACDLAEPYGITILIEPLNAHDAPGYFLRDTDQAGEIIDAMDAPNLRLMFDCYHVGRTEGDVIARLEALLPLIGHVQIAAIPDRGAPDHGELDYPEVFTTLDRLGWTRPIGAEYRPAGAVEDGLAWMKDAKRTR